MDGFFTALSQHAFLQTAVATALLASIGCGVMGTYVVVKRIAFIAGGIAHSVLGGMGAAVYFGFEPLHGALPAAITAALLIGWVRLHWRAQEDTLISALWAIGMAVGALFIAKAPGYQADLMSYLFGNILLVPRESLWFMIALDLILLILVAAYHRQFLAVVFDEEFARLRGIPVGFFYLLLLVLVAVTVVLLIQVVGLILVLALLTLPAAVAGHYVHSLGRMMLIATLLGAVLSITGLALSYAPDLPVGPTIILLVGGVYVLSAMLAQFLDRHRARLAVAQGSQQGASDE
ncbi:MAG: metal ABC transporter permease [Candidatus Thiodiazotropha sp.]